MATLRAAATPNIAIPPTIKSAAFLLTDIFVTLANLRRVATVKLLRGSRHDELRREGRVFPAAEAAPLPDPRAAHCD
jgi:hypothetical protein